MLETISSDMLEGVTGGGQAQDNGNQKCQSFINFNSCNNTQRDERIYQNTVPPLPAGEST